MTNQKVCQDVGGVLTDTVEKTGSFGCAAVEQVVAQDHGRESLCLEKSEREKVRKMESTMLGHADNLGQGGSDSEVLLNEGGGKVSEEKQIDAMEKELVYLY